MGRRRGGSFHSRRGGDDWNRKAQKTEGSEGSVHESFAPKDKSKQKRKVALLIGFCGTNYQGMQINPGANTIEKHLQDALFKAGAISQSNVSALQKIKWMRCARTDKGVHAIGQIVSCKLELDKENPRNVIEATNSFLPPDIRLFDYVIATRSFHSKNDCNARTYEYTLNLELLRPSSKHPNFETRDTWEFNEEERVKFDNILKKYLGTNRYHNFTSGLEYSAPSAQRYIMEIGCSPAFSVENLKFTRVTIKGQSFVLHQIRKMIGTACFVYRDNASPEVITKVMGNIQVNLPLAPGLGLMLAKCHFDKYEKTKGSGRQPLTFENCVDELEDFKSTVIDASIHKKESEDKVSLKWLGTITAPETKLELNYEEILAGINQIKPEPATTTENKDPATEKKEPATTTENKEPANESKEPVTEGQEPATSENKA